MKFFESIETNDFNVKIFPFINCFDAVNLKISCSCLSILANFIQTMSTFPKIDPLLFSGNDDDEPDFNSDQFIDKLVYINEKWMQFLGQTGTEYDKLAALSVIREYHPDKTGSN